jgi:hypothetical protein
MNLLGRLERLEAEQAEQGRGALPPLHIVTYSVAYGDDVELKRTGAEAEFNRLNPDWASQPEGEEIRLIEIRSVEAVNGRPKHPEWLRALETGGDIDRKH